MRFHEMTFLLKLIVHIIKNNIFVVHSDDFIKTI